MNARSGLTALVLLGLAGCGRPASTDNGAAAPASGQGSANYSVSIGDPAERVDEPTLCEASEHVVWSCEPKDGRIVSVCASAKITQSSGYIQYRTGKPGKLEQVYPADRSHPRGRFTFAADPAGDTTLGFTSAGLTYSLAENLRSDEDVILVQKDGKEVSRLTCNNGLGGFGMDAAKKLGIAAP